MERSLKYQTGLPVLHLFEEEVFAWELGSLYNNHRKNYMKLVVYILESAFMNQYFLDMQVYLHNFKHAYSEMTNQFPPDEGQCGL